MFSKNNFTCIYMLLQALLKMNFIVVKEYLLWVNASFTQSVKM